MAGEYDALYASLFKNPTVHIKVINALSAKKAGMRRSEILESAKLSDNVQFSKVLKELEQCGFLRKYTCLGKSVKDSVYQLLYNFIHDKMMKALTTVFLIFSVPKPIQGRS